MTTLPIRWCAAKLDDKEVTVNKIKKAFLFVCVSVFCHVYPLAALAKKCLALKFIKPILCKNPRPVLL